jgi:hypothetical protein
VPNKGRSRESVWRKRDGDSSIAASQRGAARSAATRAGRESRRGSDFQAISKRAKRRDRVAPGWALITGNRAVGAINRVALPAAQSLRAREDCKATMVTAMAQSSAAAPSSDTINLFVVAFPTFCRGGFGVVAAHGRHAACSAMPPPRTSRIRKCFGRAFTLLITMALLVLARILGQLSCRSRVEIQGRLLSGLRFGRSDIAP